MLFQALDDKSECVGVYCDGVLSFDKIPNNLTKTWSYSNFLSEYNVEYAELYCNGKTLTDVCPSHLIDRWEFVSGRLKAYLRANKIAKVSLDHNCFFDVTPERFMKEFCQTKNEICEWIFTKYSRPENYDHLLSIQKVLSEIRYQKLNLDVKPLRAYWGDRRAKLLYKNYNNAEAFCSYNLFGTVTGRLGMQKGSFPLLNLKKEYREIIKPNNDFFIELDYNAAEARVVLSLLGLEQPNIDIHEYHAKNLYRSSRDEAKKRFFAWLYNPNSEDKISSGQYDRDLLLSRYRSNDSIETLFKRKIKCDDFHAFNYLIQSTCADMVLDRMVAVHNLLKDRKSCVAFTLHDSVILDFSSDDKDLIKLIIEEYKNTELGNFKTSVSAGKDLYNLKLINL